MTNVLTEKRNDLFDQLDGFGRFQIIQYVLICLPLVFVSMMNINYIFVAGDVEYRCVVPECEGDSGMNKPSWWPDGVDHKCQQPILDKNKIIRNVCSNNSFLDKISECEQWIYETDNTIVSELNLACQSWKVTLVGSVHNAGMIISMLLMGLISDKFGRKPAVIICSVGGVIGVVKSFLTSYNAFLVIEFLESVMSSGLYTVAIVLMIEAGGQTKRVLAGVIFSYAVYIGEVVYAITAFFLPYWKHLVYIVYSPTIIFIIYIYLLRESTRWQLLKDDINGAKRTLKEIALSNKVLLTEKEIQDIGGRELKIRLQVAEKKDRVVLKDILESSELLKRLGVATFCFFAAGFSYYGLTIHSVLLPGNKHVNFILASITSFPGDLLAYFTFNKYGRRISLMCSFICGGIFCIATAYSPDRIPELKVALFLCGKLAIALCFTGMFTYSLELFPTSVRGSLVGLCNIGARIGSMLAPLTPLLMSTMLALPSFLFAGSAILAGVLLIFTPETKTMPLVDTIEQMEKLQYKHDAT